MASVSCADIDPAYNYGTTLNNFLEILTAPDPTPIQQVNFYFGFDLDPIQEYITKTNKYYILNSILRELKCRYHIIPL